MLKDSPLIILITVLPENQIILKVKRETAKKLSVSGLSKMEELHVLDKFTKNEQEKDRNTRKVLRMQQKVVKNHETISKF